MNIEKQSIFPSPKQVFDSNHPDLKCIVQRLWEDGAVRERRKDVVLAMKELRNSVSESAQIVDSFSMRNYQKYRQIRIEFPHVPLEAYFLSRYANF